MFPEQSITYTTVIESEEKASNSGKSFLFDFETGDFVIKDGKLVEITELEALKTWISKVLRTTKDKFDIYLDTDYGITNLKELINKDFPFAFIKAEVEKEITETLLKNSNVNSVIDFEFTRESEKLTVSFTVNSAYGTTESEVII